MTGAIPKSPFPEAPEYDRTGALNRTSVNLASINGTYAVIYLGHGDGLGSVCNPGTLWTSFGLSSDFWVQPANDFFYLVPRQPTPVYPVRNRAGEAAS